MLDLLSQSHLYVYTWVGWVRLTAKETVEGEAWAWEETIKGFKKWLTDLKNPVYQGKVKGCKTCIQDELPKEYLSNGKD